MNKTERILQNRYLVEGLIGAGGMGSVYLGIDKRFGTNVAIKETVAANERMRRAFEHEAQLLNSLRHPALPHVVDYFIEGDGQFIVMEYIAGEDLSEILKQEKGFEIENILKWADDLLDALNYLHTQMSPVIHRDIKPQNLKLTPRGEIILLDFGLAKGNPGDLAHLTMTTSIFGYSRSYASLEQIQGTGTDPRSDLYSLSSTLYHLLTQHPPIDALTRAKAILNGESDPLQPVNSFNQQIPTAVADILHQALALNANLRPQTAIEMRSMLKKAILESENSRNLPAPEDLTDNTQISPLSDQRGNNRLNNVLIPAEPALKGKNSKLKVMVKPAEKQIQSSVSESKKSLSKKSFHPSFTIAIAAAILITFGGAFAIFNTQISSLQINNSNNFQTEPAPLSHIVAKEEILPAANPANSPSSQPTAVQTTPIIESEEAGKKQKTLAAPATITGEIGKTTRQKAKPVMPKQPSHNQNSVKDIAVKEEPLKQPNETPAGKQEIKSGNQKRTGFKGLLNKISSGALYIPKNIFKKKKD